MRERWIGALCALLMLLGLAACGARPADTAPPPEPDCVEIATEPPATPEPLPEPAPDVTPEPTPEPVMLSVEVQALPASLYDFLCRFDDGYTDRMGGREFDSANAVDVRANLLAQIVCAAPCVDFDAYPVKSPVFHWNDGSRDPLNWAEETGCYAEFDAEAVRWIAQKVFQLSESDYRALLERCFYAGAFYQGQNEAGEERFFLSVGSTYMPESLIHVESAMSDGRRYEIVYDYLLRPNQYLGSYEASLELKQGESGSYWSLVRQTAYLPVEEAVDAPELFGLLTEPFVLSNGIDSWRTELRITEDGRFSGSYVDNDLSENGEDYDQAIYYADFEGRFVNPRRLNAYTYSAQLESLDYLDYTLDYIVEEDDGWRVLYRYADAVGLENCRTVYFYAPGAPVYKLPESFAGWYDCTQPLADTDLELPGWGMMNGEEGQGFAS